MLNNDAMAQLKGLKNQLEAEKEYAEAVVKGTQNRYGFAVVADGREVFIPPDEMLKVLPGDHIKICIRPAPSSKANKNKQGRTVAEVERLLDSPLGAFVGRIVTKGKAVFVEPDLPQLKRWLFIPPHARNGAKPGDRVQCAVLRHPIRDGKPSAKVLSVLGAEGSPGVENKYCAARSGITWEWPEKAAQALSEHAAKQDPLAETDRVDLTHLAFVSVDSARTLDIDDALYAEVTTEGWLLYVAVADPTALIGDFPDIDATLAGRGSSLYFHGDALPMLPDGFAHDHCALAEEQTRPAVVCKIAVSDDGEVGDFEFVKAAVRSRAKLTYSAVDRYITGHNDELIAWSNPLEALVQAYRALRRYREQHGLVMEDRREYRWILGEDKQIESIDPLEKMASQHLVEECMIAANRCAARFLADAERPGPFVVHPGFRKDRIEEAKTFLMRFKPELAETDVETLEGYQAVLAALADPSEEQPLRGLVNRMLTRAAFSATPGPHMGMALPVYTNFTSPLRKNLDFMVHRQIKALLEQREAFPISDDALSQTADSISRGREATGAAERWLSANYLLKLAQGGTTRHEGVVSHVTSAGFTVRLKNSGLEGLVDLRKDPEKFSFDKWTASLTSTTRRFQLEQDVTVDFVGVEAGGDWVSEFNLAPECGLKPAKE